MSAETPRRARLLASGLLVVTFLVGALVGAAGDRLLTAESEPAAESTAMPPAREPDRDRGREHRTRGPRSILLDPQVLEQLGTTEEQRARIQGLLERRDQELKRLFEQSKPKVDAIIKSTREEIRATLSPAQVRQLDQLIEERRARWKQNRSRKDEPKLPADSTRSDSGRR